MTRRELLGLAGIAGVVGGVATISGVLGYLAMRDRSDDRPKYVVVTDTPTNQAVVLPTPSPTFAYPRPTIVSRANWGARLPDHTALYESGFYSAENPGGWREYEGELRDNYQTVVVHHSAMYETDDITTMRTIQNLHMDGRGWADIGYHFGVGRNGAIFEGRALNVRGVHVEGYNQGSAGVVFFGNFEKASNISQNQLTQEQFQAGIMLISWLATHLALTHIAGHRDFNSNTKCPGEHLYAYLSELAAATGLIRGPEGYVPPPEQQTPSA
ncbi:MAG: hypothetical protein GYB65_11370 [Chloroflexi bacterium]|nr:hypothetical protein [Chloroflexota bacterium]